MQRKGYVSFGALSVLIEIREIYSPPPVKCTVVDAIVFFDLGTVKIVALLVLVVFSITEVMC